MGGVFSMSPGSEDLLEKSKPVSGCESLGLFRRSGEVPWGDIRLACGGNPFCAKIPRYSRSIGINQKSISAGMGPRGV